MSECMGLGFARFMELRGRRVIEKGGALWHSVGYGMYMSLPYQRRLEWDPDEAEQIRVSMRVLGIRYPSLTRSGMPSGLYVCRRKDYDISTLHRNCRSHVNHSLACSEVRRVTEEELLTQAMDLNLETLQRQHRRDLEFCDPAKWRRFVRAVQECPCITPMGAFVDGRLASYAITCFEDGWLHILYKMNSLRVERNHANKVLDFAITRQIATDPTVKAVCMGLAPLVENQGLHEYKIRMGYAFEPQFSLIRLHPALERLPVWRPGLWALRAAGWVWHDTHWPRLVTAVMEGAKQTRNGRLTALSRTIDQTSSEPHSQAVR